MARSGYVGFRANEVERKRLRELATATGKSMSAVFRELVMNARLEKVEAIRPQGTLQKKMDSTVNPSKTGGTVQRISL